MGLKNGLSVSKKNFVETCVGFEILYFRTLKVHICVACGTLYDYEDFESRKFQSEVFQGLHVLWCRPSRTVPGDSESQPIVL